MLLFTGQGASALMPTSSCARVAQSRTQPLTTTPDQPFCTASRPSLSPSKAHLRGARRVAAMQGERLR